jgi:hypothetical protein
VRGCELHSPSSGYGPVAGACEHGNEPPGSIKCRRAKQRLASPWVQTLHCSVQSVISLSYILLKVLSLCLQAILHTKANLSFLAGSWSPGGEWAGSLFTTDMASSKRQGYVNTTSIAPSFARSRDRSVGTATVRFPAETISAASRQEPTQWVCGLLPWWKLTTHLNLVTRLRTLSLELHRDACLQYNLLVL